MEIYQELLGLKFRKLDKASTWHKDVSCYEVRDAESDELMGYFYLDLFPRPDKFNHAAAFPIVMRSVIDGVITPPTTAMVTNFVQHEGEPALLKH
jgi:Zn-dependent oligopeptidase